VFGALLDDERGGRFRVRPSGVDYTTKQTYFPDTAVLVTRFFTEAGVGQVVDFMSPTGTTTTETHQLVRMVHCVRGTMSIEIEVAPRFDYGRHPHKAEVSGSGVVFRANGATLTRQVVREPADQQKARVTVQDEDLHASLDLVAGEIRGMVLESAADGPPQAMRVAEIRGLFDETIDAAVTLDAALDKASA
jgi:GH15 family glucan-1,4-alpha-glucosidase